MGRRVRQLLEILAGDDAGRRRLIVVDRFRAFVDLAGTKRIRTGSGSDRINARLGQRLGLTGGVLIRSLSRHVEILTLYFLRIAACGLNVTRCQRDQV